MFPKIIFLLKKKNQNFNETDEPETKRLKGCEKGQVPFAEDDKKFQIWQSTEKVDIKNEESKQIISENLLKKEDQINIINNNNTNNFNNNLVICQKNFEKKNTGQKRRIVEETSSSLKYNQAFAFSLSAYLQKKKDMSAILVPRFFDAHKSNIEKNTPIKILLKTENLSCNADNNAAVSEYENQVQSEIWPINCIKCKVVLDKLENFNLHMNDHWSDDKCCPVCGLLINSKRFNFKQHLKIHTGEKPFVCRVCSRAFRQKAHMVIF